MLFTGWSKNTLQRYPLPSTPPAATEANSAATIDRILTYQTIDGLFSGGFHFIVGKVYAFAHKGGIIIWFYNSKKYQVVFKHINGMNIILQR